MSILHKIAQKETWEAFYEHKVAEGYIQPAESRELKRFIEKELYRPVVDRIFAGQGFSHPVKKEISKIGKQKKRVVYTFRHDENLVLKLLTHLLVREHDHLFSPNLYSFRVSSGVKKAIRKITGTAGIDGYYSYKIDISNYFNSIDIGRMMAIIETVFAGDKEFCDFAGKLLRNPFVKVGKNVIEEQKGVMAGTPIAVFFSNLYLTALDKCFDNRDDVIYSRYSDDIIVFAKDKETLEEAKSTIFAHIDSSKLAVNREKEVATLPGEEWTFLGFSYRNGVIDISNISKEKLKGKMRRKARALIRWKNRKGKEDNMAVRAFIKRFNRKLYDSNEANETNWSRWYFPVINTHKSLKEIDAYMQDCLRYTAHEKHTKARFNYRYSQMKALGYRSLVNEWHKWRERERTKRTTPTRARKVIKNHLIYMTKSDLYIHGSSAQLEAIKKTVLTIAQHIGCSTHNESDINIPLGAVMQLLTGDALHLGLLIGMNTEDPQCVVLRFECKDIVTVYEALLECFRGIEIEVDEDVEDVPWPFE